MDSTLRMPSLAAVMLVTLGVWTTPTFCDEIHDAAKAGDLQKVKVLLKADLHLVFSKDEDGVTALHWAAGKSHKEVAEFLIANNAKNDDGRTPLHGVALRGAKDAAEVLLAHNADANVKDKDGYTPLHFAALGGRKEMAEVLLAHNADLDAKDNSGRTALYRAEEKGFRDVA